MGKAQIMASLGEGLYQARITYNTTLPAARKAALEARKPALEQQLTAATTARQTAETDVAAAQAELNLLIEQLVAATPEAAPAIRADIAKKQAEAKIPGEILAAARRKESRLTLDLAQITTEIARLDALLAIEDTRNIWCADYSTTLTGQVDTIEINGEPGQILIAPGGSGEPSALLTGAEAMSTANWARNFALHPYWQKWKPTYRTGLILSKSEDTCTVSLDQALSSYQALDINQQVILGGVPIQYLDCNGAAFRVGDGVVVRFEGQNWSSPVVVGFSTGPKPCDNYCTEAEAVDPDNLYLIQMEPVALWIYPGPVLNKALWLEPLVRDLLGHGWGLNDTQLYFSIVPCAGSYSGPILRPYPTPPCYFYGPGCVLEITGAPISEVQNRSFRSPIFTWTQEHVAPDPVGAPGDRFMTIGPFDERLCGMRIENTLQGDFEVIGISEERTDCFAYDLLLRKII